MVGESNYTECVVKRAARPMDFFLKGLLVVGVLVCALISFLMKGQGLLQLLGFALMLGSIIFAMNMWPKFNVVYEYIFVDGQIDFDAIYSGSSRKNMKRMDLEKADVVAPADSPSLDGYKHLEPKTYDFTSRTGEGKVYVIILKGDKEKEKILFEPDDNFLTYLKKKAPRTVEYKPERKG